MDSARVEWWKAQRFPAEGLHAGSNRGGRDRSTDRLRLSKESSWIKPVSKARDDEAVVCFDGLKFIPTIIDHEKDVNRDVNRGNLERGSAGAIGIDGVCACYGYREYVAVLAQSCSAGSAALPVEGLRSHLDERPRDIRRGRNGSSGCVCEGALHAGVRASFVVCLRRWRYAAEDRYAQHHCYACSSLPQDFLSFC